MMTTMVQQDPTHFTTVDHTGDPNFFLHFLDEANKIPGIIPIKQALIEALRLHPAAHVLDIGCGTGADALELAAHVGAAGHVTGVDFSEILIGEAIRRAAGRGLPVSFEVGDAQALRFPDGTFDAVRTERMLMHLSDPEKALREMARVLRPGGRMSVQDFDWETQYCDSPYKETTRKIALSFGDALKHGWIGRRLLRLFLEIGMTHVSVQHHILEMPYDFVQLVLGHHVAASGALSEQEANRWWTQLAQASAQGTFRYGITGFIVSGVKA